jgi:hypothetical protein
MLSHVFFLNPIKFNQFLYKCALYFIQLICAVVRVFRTIMCHLFALFIYVIFIYIWYDSTRFQSLKEQLCLFGGLSSRHYSFVYHYGITICSLCFLNEHVPMVLHTFD